MPPAALAYISTDTAELCLDDPSQVIPLLQVVQEKLGYVPAEAIREIAGITGASEAEIFSVVTFYKQFRLQPPGRYLVKVCDGTACHVMGSTTLLDVIVEELKLDSGDTTKDGLFTLSPVACLGCCSLAPVMVVGEETFGGLTPQKVRRVLKDFQRKASKGNQP